MDPTNRELTCFVHVLQMLDIYGIYSCNIWIYIEIDS